MNGEFRVKARLSFVLYYKHDVRFEGSEENFDFEPLTVQVFLFKIYFFLHFISFMPVLFDKG